VHILGAGKHEDGGEVQEGRKENLPPIAVIANRAINTTSIFTALIFLPR
jgi:hypothetical protein